MFLQGVMEQFGCGHSRVQFIAVDYIAQSVRQWFFKKGKLQPSVQLFLDYIFELFWSRRNVVYKTSIIASCKSYVAGRNVLERKCVGYYSQTIYSWSD